MNCGFHTTQIYGVSRLFPKPQEQLSRLKPCSDISGAKWKCLPPPAEADGTWGCITHALAHTETKKKKKRRIKPNSAAPPGQVSRWAGKAAERRIKKRRAEALAGGEGGASSLAQAAGSSSRSCLGICRAPHAINEAPNPKCITPGERLQDSSQPSRLRARRQRPSQGKELTPQPGGKNKRFVFS